MKLLVFDVGTSSMRGVLYDESAAVLAHRQIRYHPVYSAGGQVTQPPSDWLNALKTICRELSPLGVDALAVTSQRSSLIPADACGAVLTDAIMWQDTRSHTICQALKDSDTLVRSLSGTGINTVCSGGKMAWLRAEEPALYEKSAHLFVIPDYLLFHMIGEHVTDHSYASRSMLMDLRRREWSDTLLDLFGVDRAKLGRLIPPGAIAGSLCGKFAEETGLPTAIPVISSGGDQQCGTLGQGVFREGDVSVNFGTGAYMLSPVQTLPDSFPIGLVFGASALPEQALLEVSLLSCGSAVDWFLRELGQGADPAFVGQALRQSPPGANGVIALPYLHGRSFPEWNSQARASFHHLTLATGRADLMRALLEGICCEVFRGLRQAEITPRQLRFSGGLSRSAELCQLLADVTGSPVVCSEDGDATVRGAWMSATCALGLTDGPDQAWKIAGPSQESVYAPHKEYRTLYENLAESADALYATLADREKEVHHG